MPRAPATGPAPIRDAATVILARQLPEGPAVLMGQRGARAAFMPSKFVFPGGAVDPGDGAVPLARPFAPACTARLAEDCDRPLAATAFAAAAIRELWEETGLRLGRPGAWPAPPPPDWQGFATTGLLPDAGALRFIFRAITPAGRPRRFDARFFLAEAGALADDPDDFSRAADELSHIAWVPIAEARRLDLPFVTEVVLAEVAALLAAGSPQPEAIPFFDNRGPRPRFRSLAA